MSGRVRGWSIGLTAAAVAAGVALVVYPAAAGTNPIANSGFESGLSNWSCVGQARVGTGHAHSGTYALDAAVSNGDTPQCTQTVAVEPSTTYTLSAWVNGSNVYLGASGTGRGDASTWTAGTGGGSQQLSVSFTTGADTTSVTVFVHGRYGAGGYYADDFTVSGGGGGTTPPTGGATTPSPSSGEGGTPGASLPECQHFSNVVPPDRSAGPSHDSVSTGPRIDLGGRLPAPGSVHGTLAAGQVTITFDRVPGAKAYRVWRNAQSVAWIDDWGQASLTATDNAPCHLAHYTVVALRSDGSDASTGQLSQPYILADSGVLQPYAVAPGTRYTWKISSYNDAGQTASGYNTGLGICAVDTRYIPWGTRMKIDGYGYCYAADIGTWIQGQIVDVWLPGNEADGWGIQMRTITIE
jgi:3D (Asp-Asp-Asp) domain-containing protein